MKRSTVYEIAAVALVLGGAVMLGFGMLPYLNPIQFKFIFGSGYRAASIASVPASILIMMSAWLLSRKSQRLKQGNK
jgi:hypothetical protein